MSYYMCFRFEGIVKPEFRPKFEPIALRGEWKQSNDPVFQAFGRQYDDNSEHIPCRAYRGGYVDRWDQETWEHQYSAETGEWRFACALNWYQDSPLVHDFYEKILPYCVEDGAKVETWWEPWGDEPDSGVTCLEELINGKRKIIGWLMPDGRLKEEKE